jgi:hypothetical protein
MLHQHGASVDYQKRPLTTEFASGLALAAEAVGMSKQQQRQQREHEQQHE